MSATESASPFTNLAIDGDGNGNVSFADVGHWLHVIVFLPGDTALWLLSTYAAPVASAFNLGSADYGGMLSGVLSGAFWLVAFIATIIACHVVAEFDRRITGALRHGASAGALRLRIAAAVIRQRWRALWAGRKRTDATDYASDLELSPRQMAALRLHADLKPGYALSPNEVARVLGARVRATEDLLAQLRELGLLHRSFCGAENGSAYTLTAAGRGLLVFHDLSGTPEPHRKS